jgi:hypothetical protein
MPRTVGQRIPGTAAAYAALLMAALLMAAAVLGIVWILFARLA